jgi:hypothetical protein
LHGVQGVEGSNPFTPTKKSKGQQCNMLALLYFWVLTCTTHEAMR